MQKVVENAQKAFNSLNENWTDCKNHSKIGFNPLNLEESKVL